MADQPPFPERERYGCVNCGSTNHTTGDTNWCPVERERATDPPSNSEGCMTVRTHDMRYIGQGYWRCANCGYEPPEPDDDTPDHTHRFSEAMIREARDDH